MRATWVSGLILGISAMGSTGFKTASTPIRERAAVAFDQTWTIPGTANTPGLNDTRFVSDLALTNLGGSAANVTISFVGASLPPKPIALASGATTVYRNVLDALWSASGLVGAISVRSDQPLVLRARTYNTAATGTFGVALPVFASADLISKGQTADSIWVQQSASTTSGFRTNVGVVFPDAGGGEAVVTFYDAVGGAAGTLNYSSTSSAFQQIAVSSVAPAGLPIGRAEISVTRGRAAGYAIGADNVTGDTSLYPFQALPAGVQDVVVSGVARVGGRNNTFFRTDARFYNPTPDDAVVTVRFHAVGSSNPAPQSANLVVPAGRIVEVVDVLASVLTLPVGASGALRFTAERPVAVLCRTSNVDPLGVQPGTFGAQQYAVPLASFLSSADAGAVVTAIRHDVSFRTNVAFAAGPDGAGYRLSLKNAQGSTIATTSSGLGAFGWTQASIADLFPGAAIPADATLLVEVTSGTVHVYDASVDNASGDLVVTPIAPVPAAIPSSATIGSSGGSIRSADGRLTLKVPAAALAAPTTLSIAPIANTAPNAIGSAYALTPVGIPFARPAQVVLNYSDVDLLGTGTGALGLALQNGNDWFGILGGSIDPVARTLSVPISSTSPAPSSSAGPTPQKATASGNLWPYGSVKLNPESKTLPIGGTTTYYVSFVGPSSTESLPFPYTPLVPGGSLGLAQNARALGWAADEGTVVPSPAGFDAVYRTPRCLPPSNLDVIRVTVYIPNRTSTRLSTAVRILAKDWEIEVTYDSNSQCQFMAIFSLHYSRSHSGAFSLDDQLRVIDYIPGLKRSETTAAAWCPGFGEDCTQPAASMIGVLTLNDVSGRFTSTLQGDAFDLTLTAEIPGSGAFVTFQCGTSTSILTLPVPHGAIPPVAVQEFIIPVTALVEHREWIYPTTIESADVVLKPIQPPGCP